MALFDNNTFLGGKPIVHDKATGTIMDRTYPGLRNFNQGGSGSTGPAIFTNLPSIDPMEVAGDDDMDYIKKMRHWNNLRALESGRAAATHNPAEARFLNAETALDMPTMPTGPMMGYNHPAPINILNTPPPSHIGGGGGGGVSYMSGGPQTHGYNVSGIPTNQFQDAYGRAPTSSDYVKEFGGISPNAAAHAGMGSLDDFYRRQAMQWAPKPQAPVSTKPAYQAGLGAAAEAMSLFNPMASMGLMNGII
jgi:hypothetical protein